MQDSLSDKYKVHYFNTTDKNWSARLTQFNISLRSLSVFLAPENWQLNHNTIKLIHTQLS